jgi:hypothetical protein
MFEELDLPITSTITSFSRPRKYYDWRRNSVKAKCHPDRAHEAKGLCKSCYFSGRKITHPHKTREKYWREGGIDITVKEYDVRLKSQGGKCAICNKLPKENGKALAVDHCHKTGKIRGLLCDSCNKHLALEKHTPEILLKTIAYITAGKF